MHGGREIENSIHIENSMFVSEIFFFWCTCTQVNLTSTFGVYSWFQKCGLSEPLNGKPCVPILNDGTLSKFLESKRLESAVNRSNTRLKIFSGTANPSLSKVKGFLLPSSPLIIAILGLLDFIKKRDLDLKTNTVMAVFADSLFKEIDIAESNRFSNYLVLSVLYVVS